MARGRLGILLSIVALACAGAPVGAADLPPGDAVRALGNPGFEAPASDPAAPPGWGSLGSAYGTARVVQRGGRSVLELAPSAKGSTGSTSFMVYQVLDAAHFRGKKVTFGANVASTGAGINLVLWSPEGATNDFDPNVQQAAFAERRKVATVPADASTLTLGVQVLGPAGGKAWVDDVFVALEGEAPAPAAATPVAPIVGSTGSAQVRVRAGSVVREIPPDFFGMHVEWVDDANGLVKPGTGSVRSDVLALLRPLGVPLVRYPGGIHADYFDWKKAVGAESRRGEIRNPFDGKDEPVRFGLPEYLGLLKALGADGCITVNYGTGTAEDAAGFAKWFVEQGAPQRCFEVGNEIYLSGPNASGPNGKAIFKPGARYAKDWPAFAAAIRGASPGARVGAIAHLDTGAFPLADAGNRDWTVKMLDALDAKVDFFALHNGYAPVILDDAVNLRKPGDRDEMYRAMFAGAEQTRDNLVAMAQEVKRRSPTNDGAPFAITEFGTLIGLSAKPDRHAAYVDHTRTQASAVYVASLLDVYLGDPRVEATMYTNPIHRWYGNLILNDPSGLVTSPTWHLYRLYHDRFERRLVETDVSSPGFSTGTLGIVKGRSDARTLLARAATSRDGRRLTAMLVNRAVSGALDTEIALEGFAPTKVECRILAAPALHAINGPAVSKSVLPDSKIEPASFPCRTAKQQVVSLPAGSILSLVAEGSSE